jgi:hypothetical protein
MLTNGRILATEKRGSHRFFFQVNCAESRGILTLSDNSVKTVFLPHSSIHEYVKRGMHQEDWSSEPKEMMQGREQRDRCGSCLTASTGWKSSAPSLKAVQCDSYNFMNVPDSYPTKPVALIKNGEKTKLSDLSIVCANYHRIIHKSKPMLMVSELKKIIVSQQI